MFKYETGVDDIRRHREGDDEQQQLVLTCPQCSKKMLIKQDFLVPYKCQWCNTLMESKDE